MSVSKVALTGAVFFFQNTNYAILPDIDDANWRRVRVVYRASLLRKWGLRPRRFESSRLRKRSQQTRKCLLILRLRETRGFEKLLR
jgi:hypothetical protein